MKNVYLPTVTKNDCYGRPTNNIVKVGTAYLTKAAAKDAALLMLAKMPKGKAVAEGRNAETPTGYGIQVIAVKLPAKPLILK